MSANYVYNETLIGAIDGVNTTFTTLSLIQEIEDVYFGWAPYRDITFVAGTNVITFADAPEIWANQPTVDYFIFSMDASGVTWDVTFWDVIDDTYSKMGSKRTSKVYEEAQIQRQIKN